MTLVLYGRLEVIIGSMQPVQYSSTTEVIGEPEVQKGCSSFSVIHKVGNFGIFVKLLMKIKWKSKTTESSLI